MTHKFLSDGRKVAVIGKLNNDETIVQEIFVTESGDEVPSGERFIAKSLHDTPVVSYAMKEQKRAEETLERTKASIEHMRKEERNIYERLKGYREILCSVKKFTELVPEDELDIFTGFLTGTIEYLVVDCYRITPPVPMIDEVVRMEGGGPWGHPIRFESIKLLTVLGRSGGEIGYEINNYSDGSGGNTKVYPFCKKEDALNHIKNRAINRIKKNDLSAQDYDACISMGIVFDEEHEKLYRKKLLEGMLKQLECAQANKKQVEEGVAFLEKEIVDLEKLIGENI